MRSFSLSYELAQAQPSQPPNPLINTSGEDAIYIGVGGLAIGLALVIGVFSRRLATAVIVALALSAVVILLVFLA